MGRLLAQNAAAGRLQLLMRLLLIVAALFIPQLRIAEAACTKVRSVLVVGAGISGVSAARHIAVTNGECFKVTVLEARNRVGGRMWSRTEPAPAAGVGSGGVIRGEMGAQWIQSATGNPITAIARRFKLKIGEQNGEEIQYRAGGSAYTAFQLKVASAKYDWALKRAKQIANNQDRDISMEKAFRAAGNFLNPYIQSRVAVDFEFEYSGELSTLSAWYYQDEAFDPPDLVVTNGYDNIPKMLMQCVCMGASCQVSVWCLPDGYDNIPKMLMQSRTDPVVAGGYDNISKLRSADYGQGHHHWRHPLTLFPPYPSSLPSLTLLQEAINAGAQLVLSFEVTSITRLSSGAVQITGKDTPTGTTRSYTGDAAIITLPLGVLKAGVVSFSPALSARKQGAIRRVGFGNVNKVFFFYNTTFWPTWADEYFIEDAQLPGNRGRWVDWVNLKRAWGMTALEGVAVGSYANRMAQMSEAECIKDAANKIKVMFPKYKTAKVHAVWLQRWNLDPYARGAYSYGRLGMKGDGDTTGDFNILAEPEQNFLFAGEHTNGAYRASVHGGYLSGIREARRVLRSY
ncbi:unnamed protein product [Closterium sp. Yama58-4]|nr:unnamed protein product [Closterium sp. Yama58-4]